MPVIADGARNKLSQQQQQQQPPPPPASARPAVINRPTAALASEL